MNFFSFAKLSIIMLLLFGSAFSRANLLVTDTSLSNQKDVVDVIEKVFKTKLRKPADTAQVKPGKLLFAVVPGIGYSLQTKFDVVVTMNVSFYNGSPKTTNLSAITLIPEVAPFTNQVIVPIAYNIWSANNVYNWTADMRYYKYPSYTYGLGSNSTLSNLDLIDYSYIRFDQVLTRRLFSKVYAGLGYNLDYHWGINAESNNTAFQSYNNNQTSTTSSGVVFTAVYDGRTNQNNSDHGLFTNFTYRVNTTSLGADQNWQSLQAEFRAYLHPFKGQRAVLAFWSWDCVTFAGKAPYFELPSTGWDTYSNTGRGYIQGRLRGPGFLYFESEYRFNILPSGLVGGVVFANVETVSNWTPQTPSNYMQFGSLLPGSGCGLRFKLNKFSNVNFAIDYGWGTQGSQGFFLNIAEIF